MIKDFGVPFSATATGAGTVTALYSGTTNELIFVTDIATSSSGTMGTWALYAGPTGTTVLWSGSGAVNYQFSEPLRVSSGQNVKLSANGTTATYANVSGFYIKTQ